MVRSRSLIRALTCAASLSATSLTLLKSRWCFILVLQCSALTQAGRPGLPHRKKLAAVGAPPAVGTPRIDYFDQGGGVVAAGSKTPGRRAVVGYGRLPGWQRSDSRRIFAGCRLNAPTLCVAIGDDGKLVFTGGQCIELLGTHYVHAFERCPFLARVVSRKFKFPDPKDHRSRASLRFPQW
jgi:hypothetical protein